MNGDLQQRAHDQRRQARDAGRRSKAARAGRDGTVFLALPAKVTRSPGWQRASYVARSLLIAMATAPTLKGGMPLNGHLTASMSVLRELGWRGEGAVSKAVKELQACGLLHMTRRGAFPNLPALYAITWLDLGPTKDLAPELVRAFKRGTYMQPEQPADVPQRRRTAAATTARKRGAAAAKCGYTLAPYDGGLDPTRNTVGRRPNDHAPPSHGAMEAGNAVPKPPLDGANLEDLHLRPAPEGSCRQ